MLIYFIIGFLAIAIVFYCLFGGADFGAGVLGLFLKKVHQNKISDVIGPVWEANHVWLILAVVILFMGFPKIYATISLYLHIPIALLLIGIILRGTAFTFMHYDAIKGRSTNVYARVFGISSIMTPLFLGIIIGAMMLGKINPGATGFYQVFVAPWLNAFCLAMGLFCISLFTFLASIFMIGEVEEHGNRQSFIRAAQISQLCTVASGALVFLSARIYQLPLISYFLQSWIALGCIVLATLSLGAMWAVLQVGHAWVSRFLAGGQVLLILFAWFWVQHPVTIRIFNAEDITFLNSVAPEATLIQLLIALIMGSLIILPSLFFLFRTFRSAPEKKV